MTRRRSLTAAALLLTTAVAVPAQARSTGACRQLTDAQGDTALLTSTPVATPMADPDLDIVSADVAGNAHWIGAVVRLKDLSSEMPVTGGDVFVVTLHIGRGDLLMAVGRDGQTYGWAGYQDPDLLGQHDIDQSKVRAESDYVNDTVSVFADLKALQEIAPVSDHEVISGVEVEAARNVANDMATTYDVAAGTRRYVLGQRTCVALPR